MATKEIPLITPVASLADYFDSRRSNWSGFVERAKKSLAHYGDSDAAGACLADYFQNDLEGWARGYEAWVAEARKLVASPKA